MISVHRHRYIANLAVIDLQLSNCFLSAAAGAYHLCLLLQVRIIFVKLTCSALVVVTCVILRGEDH